MTQSHFFKNAKWVGMGKRTHNDFTVLRGKFCLEEFDSVKINVLGLGLFMLYINGTLINPFTFLPLSTDYEATADPIDEVLTGHRIYVPEFDITPFVQKGENTVVLHYGGGLYPHRWRKFGLPKAIYCITAKMKNDFIYFVSDENCRVAKSFVVDGFFNMHEKHDYTNFDIDCFGKDFDDSDWELAVATEPLNTEYEVTNCPIDTIAEDITPKIIGKTERGVMYDIGKNVSCIPLLKSNGGEAEYHVSECILENGELDMKHHHGQSFYLTSDFPITDGPLFTWNCCRYVEVIGDAELVSVKAVYSDVKINSTFTCDNEMLNWIYKTFIHTMLCNMHMGIPSDCPHLERRGYTGDGQLTANAVLTIMDAKAFYKKWLQDISDCQDIKTGHIQYTAPYFRSGGGPGGWGCAIVEVPYQYYRHFGDKTILEKYYGQMKRYIDYLEAHSEFSLVTSDKAGEWCLGDWCGPIILYPEKDITSHNQQVMLPAPMVNTYFMVKSLKQMCKIAEIIGKSEDIPDFEAKINERSKAITAAYFNTFDGNFVMNVQGANAYAVDLGIGSEKTYENLVSYYEKLGHYDTGIFATDILTRVLFEKGNSELAVKLLTADGESGFEHWRKTGATTFHEYWNSLRSRSHCHPMFGAVTAYLFEYLLGIKQKEGTAGFTSLYIEPKAFTMFGFMKGSITTPNGIVSVEYKRNGDHYKFTVTIPENTDAIFKTGTDEEVELTSGENSIIVLV